MKKNIERVFQTLKIIIILSAIIHLAILIINAILKKNFEKLNYFGITEIDTLPIFPNFLNNITISTIFIVIVFLAIYIIMEIFSKNR